jgi:hypothetical protein
MVVVGWRGKLGLLGMLRRQICITAVSLLMALILPHVCAFSQVD